VDISRRQALHRLSGLVGGAISAPVVGAILSGCRAQGAPAAWTPEALTPDEAKLLGTMVDLIVPATDTPGASEAGVPVFIDHLLRDWVDPEDCTRFQQGLAAVDAEAREAHGVGFGEATPEQQNAIFARLDLEAVEARAADVRPLPFFATLKEWTIVGYYTSEIGATQELHWLAVPGRYDANVPLEEVGKTWA
jgi:glucoside 3-dehydrogenase (cytochrome c) hitch-hiker subunit